MAAKMQSALPARKVWIGAVAGAGTALLVFIVNLMLAEDKQIPGEVAASLVTVLSFLLSYFVPPAKDDQIVTS
jgi:hypothetical protein